MKSMQSKATVIEDFSKELVMYQNSILNEISTESVSKKQQFFQIILNEFKKSPQLQEVFLKNPSSLFASILHCAELGLNPSQIIGEFYFIPKNGIITPLIGYKGIIALLMRSSKIKKIWSEVVYEDDDFEYELGLEPKLLHIPNHNADKKANKIKCVYACIKIEDEILFKVMFKNEIQSVINISNSANELYFNDKKDPERWMLKKIVLKQLSKLLPKDDDRLKKAVSMDDNIEGGSYLILDENNSVSLAKQTVITKKSNIYDKLMQKNNEED